MTYAQYIEQLGASPEQGRQQVAELAAATALLMRQEPYGAAEADQQGIRRYAESLLREPAFDRLMQDPKTLEDARAGLGVPLLERLAKHQQRVEQTYARTDEQAARDRDVLDAALRRMRDGSAGKSPAERERKNPRFARMLKQMEDARDYVREGAPLTGAMVKNLVETTADYIDGPEKVAGGKKPRAARTEALCVLKQLMPEAEFLDYRNRINMAHDAADPAHRDHVAVGAFAPERLRGAQPARELMDQANKLAKKDLTPDNCARLVVLHELSGGDPNALVNERQVEARVKLLTRKGTAFMRVMGDDEAKKQIAASVSADKPGMALAQANRAARERVVRAARAQLDHAARDLTQGPANQQLAGERLAAVLAARELAREGGAAAVLTRGEFAARVRSVQSDPNFRELAARYNDDPAFRRRINGALTANDNGAALENELEKTRLSAAERRALEAEERKAAREQKQPEQQPAPMV